MLCQHLLRPLQHGVAALDLLLLHLVREILLTPANTDVAGALEAMFTDDVIMPLPDRRFATTRPEAVQ